MKQGSLFSFFSKKPASITDLNGASAGTTELATRDSKPAAADLTLTDTKKEAPHKITPSPTIPSDATKQKVLPSIKIAAKWQDVTVGARLLVYWPDDDKHYKATVSAKKNKDASIFTLTYDDGEIERVDLRTESFRIIDNDDLDPNSDAQTPAKKKRKIKEESDEEEFEFDADEMSVQSEESNFEDDEQEEEEEMEQWMVTDDEIDDVVNTPKNKKKFTVTKIHPRTPISKKSPSTSSRTPSNATTPGSARSGAGSTAVTPTTQRPTPVSNKPGSSLPFVAGAVNPSGSHIHNHLAFLREPRDKQGRVMSSPDYDPHTLKVDFNELTRLDGKISPAQQQWWDIKSQYFDTVLLFKTGKFYEMFHMDADIGVKVLGFAYMKGAQAHAGFPEVGYGKFSAMLVQAGYKVARVEQTETPDMLKERKKSKKAGTKAPQVMNREVCSILTAGTRTFCYMDDVDGLMDGSNYSSSVGPLLAIKEIPVEISSPQEDTNVQPVCEYGVTIIDAVRATVTIGQFADDILRSRMNTLLVRFQPSEILVEGGENGASLTLLSLIQSAQVSSTCNVQVERIQPTSTFPQSNAIDAAHRQKLERKRSTIHPWDVQETIEEIHRRGYYPRASRQQEGQFSTSRWPRILHMCVEGEAQLALASFGAALFYLQRNLIDQEILGMGAVQAYIPPVASGTALGPNGSLDHMAYQQEQGLDFEQVPPMIPHARGQGEPDFQCQLKFSEECNTSHMALDGTTLQNLEILANAKTHTSAGSLWSKINFTKTPHGSRMLRAWLLRPLFRKADIERRADAVEELVSGGAAVAISEARNILAKVGDIERLLSRVHSMGGRAEDCEQGRAHPNERAVLYEGKTHTKRKVGDFSKVLNGLKQACRIPELFEGVDVQSGLLKKIVRPVDKTGCFPDMGSELDFFFLHFDLKAAAEGSFEPSRGFDESYDDACDDIERIEREFDEYKNEMCDNHLRNGHAAKSKWKYINTQPESKDKYFIELPATISVPDDFIVKGKRGNGNNQVNKYRTRVTEELVQELEHALDVRKEGKQRGLQMIFAKFDSKRDLWAAAAQCTAILDALGSLAHAASKPGFTRPTILECLPDARPCIHISQGRHPCVDITHSGGQFIPNNLTLGSLSKGDFQNPRVLLLSGPNMGGKSTLLRQTCLISILAQIGCFVPAEECVLTPVDRIFTRLGASDRILLGQSTFFVELAETASALRGATRRSLVIMDELGRGTSTFDGTAIASACVQHLVHNNKCLTLFATHYHSLLEEWMDDPSVRLGHMECYVEGGVDDDEDPNDEGKEHNITFLYTLAEGACPKSFGINVAKLAGLPDEILSKAKQKSAAFERQMVAGKVNSGARTQDGSLETQVKTLLERNDMDALNKLWLSL